LYALLGDIPNTPGAFMRSRSLAKNGRSTVWRYSDSISTESNTFPRIQRNRIHIDVWVRTTRDPLGAVTSLSPKGRRGPPVAYPVRGKASAAR
jgi:hypothetical protein